MSRLLSDLDPRLQNAFIRAQTAFDKQNIKGYRVRVSYTYRTFLEQSALWAIGRTKPGKIVTYSSPGTSKHEASPSLAFDVYITDPAGRAVWDVELYRDFARYVLHIDNEIKWGGNFRHPDFDHFEL